MTESFELRTHFEFRWGLLERNILNMIHSGYAAGTSLIHGHRARWGFDDGQESSPGRTQPAVRRQVVAGFLGNTRLTMSYNHNSPLVRGNDVGAAEIMLWVAGSF